MPAELEANSPRQVESEQTLNFRPGTMAGLVRANVQPQDAAVQARPIQSDADFGREMAPRLGPGVSAAGLVDRMTGNLERDEAMIAAVAALRGAGVTTVLVSNSFGFSAYEGYELESLFEKDVEER